MGLTENEVRVAERTPKFMRLTGSVQLKLTCEHCARVVPLGLMANEPWTNGIHIDAARTVKVDDRGIDTSTMVGHNSVRSFGGCGFMAQRAE